jgi:predicted transcriptional regulator
VCFHFWLFFAFRERLTNVANIVQTVDMKTAKLRPLLVSVAALALSTLGSSPALALPNEGDAAPNARLEDADGRALELKAWKGKPILIVYEDKDSATQNQALKDALSKLAKGDRYKSAVALAAVADVSSYDYWPVKGFVKDSIREESRKQGTTIYCDWSGTFRGTYRLKSGVSSIVLVGRDGHVLFAAEGAVSAGERARLLDLLKGQVESAKP